MGFPVFIFQNKQVHIMLSIFGDVILGMPFCQEGREPVRDVPHCRHLII